MILEKNGIKIDVRIEDNILIFKVLEQTKEATNLLRTYKHVRDNQTGYSLRSNEKPSFNKNERRFFIRGSDKTANDKTVTVKLKTHKEATEALEALNRLLDKVVPLTDRDLEANEIRMGNAIVALGGTSMFRFCLLSKSMADTLQLTGHKLWPDKSPLEWVPCKPLLEGHWHWDEHSTQACDVMNKAHMSEEEYKNAGFDDKVCNPHKATRLGSKKALKALRDFFQKAEEGGYLIEAWRLITFVRSTDYQ